MTADESPLKAMFWEHVPRQYMENLLQMLADAYATSHANVFNAFERETEAVNVLPVYRRGVIEEGLVACAKPFGEDVSIVTVDGAGTSFWNHNRVECGRVSFTQGAAPHPDHVLRPSISRTQYAANNGQLSLFDDMHFDRPPPADSVLYGILVHGREPGHREQLGFAVVRFPLVDLSGYYTSRIDLFAEFPEIASAIGPKSEVPAEESVGELPELELRTESDVG